MAGEYKHKCYNITMTKPIAEDQDFGEYPDTAGGRLLERLDNAVEANDEQGFVLTKQEIWRRIDGGLNDSDTVSLIALSEIDWHDNPLEYFTDWQRLSVGYVPNKYRSLFIVE